MFPQPQKRTPPDLELENRHIIIHKARQIIFTIHHQPHAGQDAFPHPSGNLSYF